MTLKHNSISELKKKLAQSLKALREGKGTKRELQQSIDGSSHDKLDNAPHSVDSNGLDAFSKEKSAKRKQDLDPYREDEKTVDDEEGLERTVSSETKLTKLEDEQDLKSLVNPNGNLFHRRI